MNISYKNSLLLLLILVFIVGAVAIIDRGRPVKDLDTETEVVVAEVEENEVKEEEKVEEKPTTPITTTPAKNTFTSTEVASHAVPEDCWASVSGGVYDLTTWVERHPGGSAIIKSLCGTDATVKFTNKHGESSLAKSALGLLKIGTLAP